MILALLEPGEMTGGVTAHHCPPQPIYPPLTLLDWRVVP